MTEAAHLCAWCDRTHVPGVVHCLRGVLLVCGGRDFEDWPRLVVALDRVSLRMVIHQVRHGDCPSGADHLAGRWARMRAVPVDPIPADWGKLRKAAGPIRNSAMLAKDPTPVACVAFTPGPSGTHDMVAKCGRAGVPVWKVGW